MPFQGLTGFGGGATGLSVSGPSGPTIDASGGTTATPGDGYKYHFYTSSSTFVVNDGTADVEYFVVGGGGGGGGHAGGGGGGSGGIRHNLPGIPNPVNQAYPVSAGTYTITIGEGGEGAPPASSGSDRGPYPGGISAFYLNASPTETPISGASYVKAEGGGGGGGGNPGLAGGCGGSGGGGTGFAPGNSGPAGEGNTDSDCGDNPAWTSIIMGYDGGISPTARMGGGGGGAGAVGQASDSNDAGEGGNGLACPMCPPSYGSASPAGDGRWLGGGGGGGVHVNANRGEGGAGGGGEGGAYGTNGNAGGANHGGGVGGAGGTDGSSAAGGGDGGSGFAFIRYQV